MTKEEINVAEHSRYGFRKRVAIVFVSVLAVLCAVCFAFSFKSIARAETANACFSSSDHSDATEITSTMTTLAAGNYYLASDVTIAGGLTVSGDSVVKICLNGHVLKGDGTARIISMNMGSTLYLYDCNSSECTHYYTKDSDGCYHFGDGIDAQDADGAIEGGVITGGQPQGTYHAGAIHVSAKSKLYMYGGTISGNISGKHGGAIFADAQSASSRSEVYLNGGRLCGNVATQNGGGIYVTANAVCEMSDGFYISDNSCKGAYSGGGVYVNVNASFTMSGGAISANSAKNGGGVCALGVFMMSGGTITDHTVEGNGGGVNVDGTFDMSGGSIVNCTASRGGGVNVNSAFEMTGGSIEHCNAYRGGGVYVTGGDVSISDGEIINNTSTNHGGGVYVNSGSVTVDNGTINYNGSATSGGGMFVTAGCSVTVRNSSSVSGNTAVTGGAFYIHQNAALQLEGGTISANAASGNGGGVFLNVEGANFGTLTMTGGSITSNRANRGGGVFVLSSNAANALLDMSGGSVKDNIAVAKTGLDEEDNVVTLNSFGGGVYASGTVKLSGAVDITGNKRYAQVPDDPNVLDARDAADDDMYLASDNAIQITGKLADTNDNVLAKIGVGAAGTVADRVFTSGFSVHNSAAPTAVFKSNDKTYLIASNTDDDIIECAFKTCMHIGTTVNGGVDAATCTQDGAEHYSCSYCGATWDNAIPKLGHSFGAYVPNNDATCTANGTETAACTHSGCTQDDTREIADSKLEHTYGEYVVYKEPTYDETGEEHATCSVCGDVKARIIPVLTEETKENKPNLLWLYILITALVAVIVIFVIIFVARKKKRR